MFEYPESWAQLHLNFGDCVLRTWVSDGFTTQGRETVLKLWETDNFLELLWEYPKIKFTAVPFQLWMEKH